MSALVFRDEPANGGHALTVGGLTAAEGLALLDPSAAARVVCFGATGFERHGWATEKELPTLRTVAEVRSVLAVATLGLIELEVEVEGFGRLCSERDEACTFHVASRAALAALVEQLAPGAHAGLVLHALLTTPGGYFACSAAGVLQRHASLAAFLASRA